MKKISPLRGVAAPGLLFFATVLVGCQGTSSSADSSPTSGNEIIRFNEICDGSAAVQLQNKNLVIANDEQNSLFEFTVSGGAPVQQYPYGQLLGAKREVDVEAAVATQGHVWWTGSHGNDGKGRSAPSRQHLFKTQFATVDNQTRITVVGNSVDLLPALISDGKASGFVDASTLASEPKQGGINIEGLSVMDNGDLLVGLRSPLSGGLMTGDALIAEVKIENGTPEVVKFHRLDLADRGIRDLQKSEKGYLLIAGDVASGGEFAIYRWQPGAELRKVRQLPGHFNAEALVDVGDSWLVISDDGKEKRSDDDAKDGDRKCDTIRRKSPLREKHPGVFFRALRLDHQTLQ